MTTTREQDSSTGDAVNPRPCGTFGTILACARSRAESKRGYLIADGKRNMTSRLLPSFFAIAAALSAPIAAFLIPVVYPLSGPNVMAYVAIIPAAYILLCVVSFLAGILGFLVATSRNRVVYLALCIGPLVLIGGYYSIRLYDLFRAR